MYSIFKGLIILLIFITSRNRGGVHKQLYRKIDFKRNKFGVKGIVFSVEYDPNRNARICLLNYIDGEKRYIIHPRGLKVGDSVISDFDVPIKLGNALPLSRIPLGTLVHNVEFQVLTVLNYIKFLTFLK